MRPVSHSLLAAACLLAAAGCSSGRYPVKGTISFEDGNPAVELAGGMVFFDSKEMNIAVRGKIQPDATFELGTDRAGDGAKPGVYAVYLRPPPHYLDGPRPLFMDLRYEQPNSSGLTATVAKGSNVVPLTIARSKKKFADFPRPVDD